MSDSNDETHSSPSPPPQPQPVSVGLVLSTAGWWDHYYTQQHDAYWDWYLPNDIVEQKILEEATQCAERRQQQQRQQQPSQCDQPPPYHDAPSDSLDSSPSSPSPSPSPPPSLSSLSTLQIGCGNSEITFRLYQHGMVKMMNIDFSEECIQRMNKVIRQEERIGSNGATSMTTTTSPTSEDDSDCAPSPPAAVVAPAVLSFDPNFSFSVMDVRSLNLPSHTFDLVFDKGTMDCIVLDDEQQQQQAHPHTDSPSTRCSPQRAIDEVYRVLASGGVSMCFSIYPPQVRLKYWLNVENGPSFISNDSPSNDAGSASPSSLAPAVVGSDSVSLSTDLFDSASELCDLFETDNPPHLIRTSAPWSEIRWTAFDQAPLELPNQKHTYLYVAIKR